MSLKQSVRGRSTFRLEIEENEAKSDKKSDKSHQVHLRSLYPDQKMGLEDSSGCCASGLFESLEKLT